jgi:hypothetical protein
MIDITNKTELLALRGRVLAHRPADATIDDLPDGRERVSG